LAVPNHQSRLLYEALKNAGVRVKFHAIKGAGHGLKVKGASSVEPKLYEMVEDFFDRHFKASRTAP